MKKIGKKLASVLLAVATNKQFTKQEDGDCQRL